MADELKPCPRCQKKPVMGGINFHDMDGKPVRHEAIRCLHCHYWFYVGADPEETVLRWNTRTETQSQATIEELVGALRKAEAAMTCRGDDAHYCPNCDNTTFSAREEIRTILSRHKGEGE